LVGALKSNADAIIMNGLIYQKFLKIIAKNGLVRNINIGD